MTCYQYTVVFGVDPRDTIDALEAKGEALGLGPLQNVRDIVRSHERTQFKPFASRHEGYRLYLKMKPGDTIVFPAFSRAFLGLGDFHRNLKRWVTAGIRVIVIDMGLDTNSEFGRSWTAVFIAMNAAVARMRPKMAKRASDKGVERGRAIMGLVRRGPKGKRTLYVEPTMYELGMKCQEWVTSGWSYDEIETHLWKTKIYRRLQFAPRALTVSEMSDPTFAKRWTANAVRTLVSNIPRINEGVLSGVYRLGKWRPESGPLSEIPQAPMPAGLRRGNPAPQPHWDKAVAIGRRIRELRLERKMTQSALGKECAMTQSMIADLEKGKHGPKTATIARVAGALGVPIETFNLKPAVPV